MRKAVTMVCILLLAGFALAQRPPGWDGQVTPEDEIRYGKPAVKEPIPPSQEHQDGLRGNVPEMDANTWSWGPRSGFRFTRFDGEYFPGTNKVYFLGGRLADGTTTGAIWSYDPVTQTYANMGVGLQIAISNYDVVYLRDNWNLVAGDTYGLYVVGGRMSTGVMTRAVQVYYPRSNTVRTVTTDPYIDTVGGQPPVPGAIYGCGGKLYAFGGLTTLAGATPYVSVRSYVYDPLATAGTRWTRLGDLGVGRG